MRNVFRACLTLSLYVFATPTTTPELSQEGNSSSAFDPANDPRHLRAVLDPTRAPKFRLTHATSLLLSWLYLVWRSDTEYDMEAWYHDCERGACLSYGTHQQVPTVWAGWIALSAWKQNRRTGKWSAWTYWDDSVPVASIEFWFQTDSITTVTGHRNLTSQGLLRSNDVEDLGVHVTTELRPTGLLSLQTLARLFVNTIIGQCLQFDRWESLHSVGIEKGASHVSEELDGGILSFEVLDTRIGDTEITVGMLELGLRSFWNDVPTSFSGEVRADLGVEIGGKVQTFVEVEVKWVEPIDGIKTGVKVVNDGLNATEISQKR